MSRNYSNSKSPSYELANVSEVDYESPVSTSADYKRHPIYSRSEWLLETVTSIVSFAILIGIGCIFWFMDNQPLSAWPIPVSIGATISILTTACTAALMYGVSQFIGQIKWLHFKTTPRKLSHLETFDEASRGGIWGCITLLTTIKWNLATIGAFITILRLTFAPFAQQVVLFEQRDVITADQNVTFGYTHKYFANETGQRLATANVRSIPQDPYMQSAVLQGLYGISTPAVFTCPGSQCQNVTEETLQTTTCRKDSDSVITHCNMTTPNGLGISTQSVDTDSSTTYFMNATSMALVKNRTTAVPENFPEIARFATYRSTLDYNFHPWNINITQCSLSVTAYKYTDAKGNGSEFAFGKIDEVDFGGTDRWENIDSRVGWGTVHTNESKADNIPSFDILYTSLAALGSFLESQTIVSEWVEGNFQNKNLGLVAALSGDVDLDARFKQMATSMTDYLRSRQEAETARGEIIQSQTDGAGGDVICRFDDIQQSEKPPCSSVEVVDTRRTGVPIPEAAWDSI
ncbi:acid phosphatase protein [Rutstroemia sp. NJR-2017a BBW]|nr:acid phosphatase protein [Rutstroemia sp. NJR-2017a BBW]